MTGRKFVATLTVPAKVGGKRLPIGASVSVLEAVLLQLDDVKAIDRVSISMVDEDDAEHLDDAAEPINASLQAMIDAKVAEGKAKIEDHYFRRFTVLEADAGDRIAAAEKAADDRIKAIEADAASRIAVVEQDAAARIAAVSSSKTVPEPLASKTSASKSKK